jgi:hypothetical protein
MERKRDRYRDLLDPIHERGLEREREKKTWIVVMEKR